MTPGRIATIRKYLERCRDRNMRDVVAEKHVEELLEEVERLQAINDEASETLVLLTDQYTGERLKKKRLASLLQEAVDDVQHDGCADETCWHRRAKVVLAEVLG